MPRIVTASASEDRLSRLSGVLASSGYEIFRRCISGTAVRRAVYDCDNAVVVIEGNMPDFRLDEFVWDFKDRVRVLLIADAAVIRTLDIPEVFTLGMPCNSQMILGAVEMLVQMLRSGMPRRTESEKTLVQEAEKIIMERQDMTESEAHRFMQRHAMNFGIKLTDYAKRILKENGRL